MNSFAIIGVAGFVAKRHINCIKSLNGKLVAALDPHDNVGFIDNYFSNCIFFKKETEFFKFIKKKKIDYVVICSPSFLHFKHIKKSIMSNSNVIVEKPPVLEAKNLRSIYKLEQKHKKKCYCIFQLRLNKKLINLKNKIKNSKKINKVKITYYTFRGDWYFKTWKNVPKFSGGLLINIGVHFFDILFWIFGNAEKIEILKKNQSTVSGKISLEKANVDWIVSIQRKKLSLNNKLNFYRAMHVNGKKYNFDNFNNLHPKNYKKIIMENKFHIKEFENIINFLPKLK